MTNRMKLFRLFAVSLVLCMVQAVRADDVPTIDPTVTFVKYNGEETDSAQYAGQAPITGRFRANPENVGDYTANYEWRFMKLEENEPYLIRYEEDTDYTFTTNGTHIIVVYATFVNGTDTVAYTQEWWEGKEPFRLVVSESRLEMPNAFSPNHDDRNEIYGAKTGWQSIVEFHAAIYNRWGQKLYEWDDPAGGEAGCLLLRSERQGCRRTEVSHPDRRQPAQRLHRGRRYDACSLISKAKNTHHPKQTINTHHPPPITHHPKQTVNTHHPSPTTHHPWKRYPSMVLVSTI